MLYEAPPHLCSRTYYHGPILSSNYAIVTCIVWVTMVVCSNEGLVANHSVVLYMY